MSQMKKKRLQRLIGRRIITKKELDRALSEAENAGTCPEEILIENGIPRHELLLSLAGNYECPLLNALRSQH